MASTGAILMCGKEGCHRGPAASSVHAMEEGHTMDLATPHTLSRSFLSCLPDLFHAAPCVARCYAFFISQRFLFSLPGGPSPQAATLPSSIALCSQTPLRFCLHSHLSRPIFCCICRFSKSDYSCSLRSQVVWAGRNNVRNTALFCY